MMPVRFLVRAAALSLALACFLFSSAQSGKSFFKEGEKLRAGQRLEQAVEKYSLAIQVDPGMVKAYTARGDVYAQLGKMKESAADRRRAAELDPSDAVLAASAGKAYLDLGEAREARAMCDKALQAEARNLSALQTKTRACLALNDLDCARQASDEALGVKATTDTYYLHGIVRTALRDYPTAEADLEKVIEWNYLYEDAYIALAEVQLALYDTYSGPTMQMRTLDKAAEQCTRALELNPQSTNALFTRSKVYAHQKEFSKAIDDVSKCQALGRTDRAVYLQRARYYQGYGQQQNAINDLNQVLLQDPKDLEALLLRAHCKEANLDLEEALDDIDAAKKYMMADSSTTPQALADLGEQRERVAARLFEMNRESDPPIITVDEPLRVGDVVQVSSALARVKVTGHVRDRNRLKSIRVNGSDADFTREDRDPEFFITVPLAADAREIAVEATDLYDNVAGLEFRVERTEGIAPTVAITMPEPSGERQITVTAGKEDVFIEGRVTDGSRIRSITVDGIYASFIPDTTAADFSIKLPIAGKDKMTVRAEDQYGNSTEVVYALFRRSEPVAVVKPPPTNGAGPVEKPAEKPVSSTTGITWVIFIENTNYANFPALQGPAGDVAKMQKAFAKYSIQKTITKRNLGKQQIERFFNIELRDLVRTNKVNTVLVWYAGHGRTVSGRTYWIPVDGRKDDIYSFYNYGPLKGLIQNYSESVTNTLVVSDAAGADPSFYELTR